MNRRYLNIDSKYRDRNLFPQIARFEIPISQTGTKSGNNALDPVSNATPTFIFNGSFDRKVANISINGGLLLTGVGFTSNSKQLIITSANPNTLRTGINFYRGSVIVITDGGGNIVHRIISSYTYIDTDTAVITLEDAVPDSYIAAGTTWVMNNPTDTTLLVKPSIFIPYAERITNFYYNYVVYNVTLNEQRTVTYFDGVNNMAILDSPAAAWLPVHDYILRLEMPSNIGAIVNVNSSTTFELAASVSNIDDIYIGGYFRIASPLPTAPDFDAITTPYNENRRIIDYNGTTRVITIDRPFTVLPVIGQNYELLQFTKDNAIPFVFTGSQVSQQDMVCYEVELVSLILPNVSLTSGGRIAFYPYVWVELSNVSATGGGLKNIIYSNNPASNKMLFKSPIFDTTFPTNARFIKIDGDGTVQTVKFKVYDNLKFSVHLPNGSLFTPEEPDTSNPSPPNSLLNISALFSFKRV